MAAVGFSFPTIDARSSPIFEIGVEMCVRRKLFLISEMGLAFRYFVLPYVIKETVRSLVCSVKPWPRLEKYFRGKSSLYKVFYFGVFFL